MMRKQNEKALKKSKDVTNVNGMNRKEIFDMINAEADEISPEGELFNVQDSTKLIINQEEAHTDRNQVDYYKSRNSYKDDFLNV